MSETPLEKLIATMCDPTGLTDAEAREELAEQGIDLDAAKARFRPKLDDLMRARAVRLALASLKANPPHPDSPLPWYNDRDGVLYCRSGYEVCGSKGHVADHRHIAAAVNAAPVLAAEVERLTAQLAAARVAVERMRERECYPSCRAVTHGHSCTCGAVSHNDDIAEARRAVGLEESHG